MPVDRSRRLLFVHVPKTAGTSVERATGLLGDWRIEDLERLFGLACTRPPDGRRFGSAFLQHLTYRELARVLDRETLANLRTFTVVRNPWDRLVSVYANPDPHLLTQSAELGVALAGIGFSEFLERTLGLEHAHLRPQLDYLLDDRGDVAVDHVLRFERLTEDFERFCRRMGIGAVALPHENRSARGPYSAYYDDRTRALVAQRYACDIETFGYRFGLS